MHDPCPICGSRTCNPRIGHGDTPARKLFETEREFMQRKGTMLRLTQRVYLNADKTEVVPHGHPDAAFLLGTTGALISEADAKRLGVKYTEEVKDMPATGFVRSQLAAVPADATDDKLYDDQSERGVQARKLAREMQQNPIREYVKSTGGSDEEADLAAAQASGNAAPKGPTKEEQDRANAAQRHEGAKK